MSDAVVARVRSVLGLRSTAHRSAHRYWKACSCTFLAADPTYYDRQESALRHMLQTLTPRPGNALDVGCGNGRFSFVVAEFVPKVIAFDLSQTLIDEAKEMAGSRRVRNVAFEARDLEQGFPSGSFGLVTCMGVTSTLIDEGIFGRLVRGLHDAVENNGFLVTKDSLSAGDDRAITSGGYITVYRSARRYEDRLTEAGFVLIDVQQLAEWDGLVNRLFLWRKAMFSSRDIGSLSKHSRNGIIGA